LKKNISSKFDHDIAANLSVYEALMKIGKPPVVLEVGRRRANLTFEAVFSPPT
jgi:hypothetical protein